MEVVENDALAEKLLNELMAGFDEDRSEMHPSVTDLIYCLTKNYYQASDQKLDHTFRTKQYFLIGLGLEKALLAMRKVKPIYGECEGVHYHMDSIDDGLIELKSTRARPGSDFSDGWVRQTKAYCYAQGIRECDIVVIHLIQPDFKAYNVTYTQNELDLNWAWIKARKLVWDTAQKNQVAPKAFAHNEKWECKDCTYSMVCTAKNRIGL